MSCDVQKHQQARVNLRGWNVFQLRPLTPDLLFHSGPAVFLTVYEESEWNRGRFVPRCVLSQPREAGEQWRNLTAGEEGRGGGTARPLSLLFTSFLIDFFFSLGQSPNRPLLHLSFTFSPSPSRSASRLFIVWQLSGHSISFAFFFRLPPSLPPSLLCFSLFSSVTLVLFGSDRTLFLLSLSLDSKETSVRLCSRHLFCRLFVACVFYIPVVSLIFLLLTPLFRVCSVAIITRLVSALHALSIMEKHLRNSWLENCW